MTDNEIKEMYRSRLTGLFNGEKGNIIPDSQDADPSCRGLKLFDEPLIGFGDALDPLFGEYKKPGVIGPWYKTPSEWMEDSKTVISFFFPFTEEVRSSNRAEKDHCSLKWAYARYEGQQFQNQFMRSVLAFFEEQGIKAMIPEQSPLFGMIKAGKTAGIDYDGPIPFDAFGSNWSERHAAFVCGLGTFGLSRGLITEKGMAGRFSSILIDKKIEADKRPYTDVCEYCTKCGACISRCPFGAITLENGKNHMVCVDYQKAALELYSPRYGCGLCQTGVPCEAGRP